MKNKPDLPLKRIKNIKQYPSEQLQIIAVGENSYSQHLATKLYTDFLYNSHFCTIERDNDTYDLDFIPEVSVIIKENRCVLMFVDMMDGMVSTKLSAFLGQLKEKSIPVILYVSIGTLLSMAHGASYIDEFNEVKATALALREYLFALLLIPFDFILRLNLGGEDEYPSNCYPVNVLLLNQDWQQIVFKYPDMYSDISYFIIQSIQMKISSYQKQLPKINTDFARTLTRQKTPPSSYRLHIIGNEYLTEKKVMEIADNLYLAENIVLGVSNSSCNALTNSLFLIFCFGYPFQNTVKQPTCIAIKIKDETKIKKDVLVIDCHVKNFGLLNWAATLKHPKISDNKDFFFGMVAGLLETYLKEKPSPELLTKTANDLFPLATIKAGDTLLVNLADYIWIGKVLTLDNIVNKIPITWLKHAIPIKILSNQLQEVLSTEMLSLDISDFSEEINKM